MATLYTRNQEQFQNLWKLLKKIYQKLTSKTIARNIFNYSLSKIFNENCKQFVYLCFFLLALNLTEISIQFPYIHLIRLRKLS